MSTAAEIISANKTDAVTWLVTRYKNAAEDTPVEQAQYTQNVARLLSFVSDSTLRESYVSFFTKGKEYNLKMRVLKDAIASKQEAAKSQAGDDEDPESGKRYPKWFDVDEAYERGFCEVEDPRHLGYWCFSDAGSGIVQVTTFLIEPIFQVAGGGGEESRYILEVRGRKLTSILEIQSSALVSREKFQVAVADAKVGVIKGANSLLLCIVDEMLDHFPRCYELREPGWQPEGFWTYTNAVCLADGTQVKPDRFGIFQVGEQNFLIPSASEIYKNHRADTDPFEIIRTMRHIETPITFAQWARQMNIVYGEPGRVAVAYAFLTVFRDFIFKINGNCPHLYFYGETQSGKSQAATSIKAIFADNRPAFNLNTGTDFAFSAYVEAGRNHIAQMNEFDDGTCEDKRFQQLKGMFDGEGRMRGKINGGRNDVEMQKVNSTILLTGQFIVTKDDNSIVNRSIVIPFAVRDYTQAQKDEFEKLRSWQEAGLTALSAEIMKHRKDVLKAYRNEYDTTLSAWRKLTKGEFNQRIFQNWCHLATLWTILEKPLHLPGESVEFSIYCYNQAKEYSSFVRRSDALTKFWSTVEQLLDAKLLIAGWHFKIESVASLKLRNSDGTEVERSYEGGRKVLFLRLEIVHGLYQKMHRERHGTTGMTLENVKHYLANRDYLLGQVKQMQFKQAVYKEASTTGDTTQREMLTKNLEWERKNTSAYAFDYDRLNVELESLEPIDQNPF